MSSVYDNPLYGGPFWSSKAVDGNKDPVALKPDNSCSITLSEANPWWAVDLGAPLAVGGIVFTTAANNMGTYAEFFFSARIPSFLRRRKATRQISDSTPSLPHLDDQPVMTPDYRTHTTPQRFYGPFSETTRVSRRQNRTSGFYDVTERLTEADTQTIRLGATPSGLTSAHLHYHPFLQVGCPSCRPTNSVTALKTNGAFGLGRRRKNSPRRWYLHRFRAISSDDARRHSIKIYSLLLLISQMSSRMCW